MKTRSLKTTGRHGDRVSIRLATLLALTACLASGCESPAATTPSKTVTILAAASTARPMRELARRFSAKTQVTVLVSASGSNALAQQIVQGAPADLFVSASQSWMDEVDRAGLVREQRLLLTNDLVLIVPKSATEPIASVDELISDKVERLALAGENVPAGIYANQALQSLNLLEPLIGSGRIVRGHDVRQTASFVVRGEADAGIVYASDAQGDDSVVVIHVFESKLHDPILYPAGLLKTDPENAAGRQFYEFLNSQEAINVFESYGFRRVDATGQGE